MKPSVAWLILRNGKKLIGFCICWGNFYLPPIYSRGIFEICCKMLTSHPINSCRSAIAVSRLPSISFPSNKYFIKLPTRSLFFLGDYYPLLLPSSFFLFFYHRGCIEVFRHQPGTNQILPIVCSERDFRIIYKHDGNHDSTNYCPKFSIQQLTTDNMLEGKKPSSRCRSARNG